MDKEQFTGELRVLQRLNKYEFAFEADILRDGPVQRGTWDFRNLEANYKTFKGQPVLVAYTRGGNKVGDGHNAQDKIDPKTGKKYRSFTAATAERIVGMISEDEEDLTLIERDGHTWVRVKGRIWAVYAKELIDHILLTGSMAVSIEVMVAEQHKEGDVEVFEVWNGIGLTILGDDVAPAVPGANIRALAAMQDEFKEMKLRVASLVKEGSKVTKPQNTSTKKGMKKLSYLSKQQLRELQPKFGESWTVLTAKQTAENGIVACLMDKEGKTATYTMASLDETVYPEKVQVVNAQVVFCADGDEDVRMDACDMNECAAGNVKELSERAEAAESKVKECEATIEQMVSAENARRLAAAKETAKTTLEAFNENREDKVDVKVLEALNKDIEAGKFTACEDDKHVWNGDKLIEKEVKALCADAVMELDKKAAEKRTDPQMMTWGSLKKASAAPGTIGELFASKKH